MQTGESANVFIYSAHVTLQ